MDFQKFVGEQEETRRPWLFVRKGKGGYDPNQPRDEIGRWTAAGKRGVGAAAKGKFADAIRSSVPESNRNNLELGEGGQLFGATMKDSGDAPEMFMYNSGSGTLLVGSGQLLHADILAKYPTGEPYDDYVKMGLGMEGELRIYVDRHTGRDVADRWDKAFEAAKQMKRVGWPGKTPVQLMYGGGQETGPTSRLEEF